jgi:uncharacterized membrane protein (GlpM family)
MTPSINSIRSLLIVSYGSAIGSRVFNNQPALVGALAVSFGFTEAQLGNIVAIAMMAMFALVVSSFFWVHRVSWRTTVTVGASVACFGAMSLAFVGGPASEFAHVATSLALIGAGGAAIYVVTLAYLATSADPTRAFGVAITMQVCVAAMTVFLIPTYLLPLFGINGVVGLFLVLILLAFGILPMIPENRQQTAAAEDQKSSDGSLLLWVLLGLAAMTIYFVGLNGTWVFLERLGADKGLSGGAIGGALAASLLFGAIGSFGASVIGRRMGAPVALCLSGAGFLLFVLLMLESSSAIAFGIALVIFNAAWNFSLPYQMDLISQADPETRYIVLVPAAQTIGGAIGPAIAGPLLMSSGVAAIYVQMVVGIGVAFFLYGLIARRMRTR